MRITGLSATVVLLIIFVIRTGIAQQPGVGFKVEKIADGFQFVEGPVWKNGELLFSDIPANTVYRWHPDQGVSVFLNPSGNSNGLALNRDGHLLLAQHGNRRLALLHEDGTEEALATHYDGKRLNSPNDIAVKTDGSIFFTDPPYGISQAEEELHFYGIYRLSPSGKLQLLDASLYRPNGLAFSPDETILYAGDSEARRIYIWDVVDDSTITNKRQFAFMNASGYTDGMKVDENGRLFATGPFGVWVYDPDGTVLDTILVPGQTTNCNWGDPDGKGLYVTSGTALYRVTETSTLVIRSEQNHGLNRTFELQDNYPNPFNGTTQIRFQLWEPGLVRIDILNGHGACVDTITDRYYSAGSHRVVWNSRKNSSGVYFAQAHSAHGSACIKCLVIK